MKLKNITKISVIGITLLAVGLLLVPELVNANNQLRPFKMSGEGYKIIETEEHFDIGFGTHIGKCTVEWISFPDEENPLLFGGYGTIYAANGDTIDFDCIYTISPQFVIEGTLTSTGGTGRFEDVNLSASFLGQIYSVDEENRYYTYSAEGTISY